MSNFLWSRDLCSQLIFKKCKARLSILHLLSAVLLASTFSLVSSPTANADTQGAGGCIQTFTVNSGSGSVAVTELSGYCYVAFKNTGAVNTQTTFSWTRPSWVSTLENVLIVAGGGGGGAHVGAGGGAGGLLQLSNQNISSLSQVELTVGAGGQGAFTDSGGDVNQGASVQSWSFNGQDSVFNGTTSTGGGRGAFWWNESPSLSRNGLAATGGSGGGAVNQTGANTPGASGTSGQGFSGGNGGTGVPGANYYQTGGGGGSSSAGGTASDVATIKSGDGGAGSEVSWLNSVSQTLGVGHWVSAQSKTYFAGGGGGGFHTLGEANLRGLGGVGGGGDGAGPTANPQVVTGVSGTANTGGGGGGSGAPSSSTNRSTGGAGGSGVVVFRYLLPSSDTDSAMVFNGTNQYATASSDVAGFDIASAITIEAWVYPTGSSCGGYIVVKTFSYYLYCTNGILHYLLVRSNDGGGSGVSTGITIPTNQWTHIAMTRATNASTANIYIDGILQFSGASAATAGLYNSNRLFAIGAQDSAANFFNGQIDEVKLWNVARSASEVKSDLKTYGGTLADGLVAYFDFNDLYETYLVNRSIGGSGNLHLNSVNSPTLSSSAIFTTTTSSPYSITSFTRNYLVANNGWKSPSTSKIKYLIVAGGGGGGAGYNGGGGGAGGYLESTTSISANTYYPIVVGVGGRGGLKIYGPTNGETSTAFSIIASGGGRGGTEQQGMSGPNLVSDLGARGSGGSGGGGNHGSRIGNDLTGGEGTVGQGSSGGPGSSSSGYYVGGGGGGANAVGGSATVAAPGNGGAGKTSTITGASLNLAGGGGGAGRGNTISRVGTASFGGGAGGLDLGVSGTTNTGGGGGGATSYTTYGISTGGSGGSGLIVLRYLTSSPTINLQPVNDTTTAGLTDSFTVGTTTLSDPFTKSVKWQVATDTVTAAASVSWIDVTSGSGSTNGTGFTTDTFTTGTLTTAMNKFRYRAIVTFSDSDSLTVVETSTVAILTINPAITITSSTETITQKYGTAGATRTVTFTGGTDTRTVSASSLSLADGKITFDTTTARFTIDTRTAVGTYLDTITVTDAKGATASYVQTIIFTVADTLTVTSDTPTALTYTGSEAVFTETVTAVSGLVTGDVISGATYNYSASAITGTVSGFVNENQTLTLSAPSGSIFTSIAFASYGTPNTGSTPYTQSACHAASSSTKVGESFIGLNSASIGANNSVFGDPCGGTYKKLAVTLNYQSTTPTIEYGPTTTKPTNAGTYVITPSVLTFSDGAASNYAAITYQSSTLTINKAAQAALIVVPLYLPFNGNPTSATLLTTGGSDTGTVSYAYVSSLSTAGGCALSGADSSTVTVTSDGTCRIVATKAATNNYLIAISDTGTVTFHLYISNIPAPRPAEYPTEIVLSGATAMTSNGLAPTITTTGVDFTAAPGATFTIAGSGFVGTRLVRVSGTSASFTVLSDTSLQITMPSGLVGISGPIYVEKAEGSRVSEDWVTGTA